ncbi:hypothetical protein [Fulvivirga maritima]|nr:hypothetical protein [Fulvivirga maritima]
MQLSEYEQGKLIAERINNGVYDFDAIFDIKKYHESPYFTFK